MVDIEQRQAARLLVLKTIYEAADGRTNISVMGQELLVKLGLPDQELAEVCAFLADKGLITASETLWRYSTPYLVNVTLRGIEEMEEALQSPRKPTQHFPPAISIVHIGGNAIGSPIQSGSPGATQEVTSDVSISDIRDFLSKLKEAAPELDLPEDKKQELTAELATLEAQVNSPKPKKPIIRESLHSIRAILEGTGGALAATGLLEILSHIHF